MFPGCKMNKSNATYPTVNASTTFPSEPPTTDNTKWREVIYVFLSLADVAIFMTGLVGNFIVVFAFVFYKKLRTSVTNYFVISLAVSDILTSGLVTTFKLESFIKKNIWTHGEFMCSLYTTMYLLAVPSSVINLCAVTVDRYLVLRMPLRYNSLMPPRRAFSIIVCLWIYAIIWACLPVMGWSLDEPVVSNGYCFFISTREYNITVNIVNFLLPMIFMAMFWSFIYAIVLQHVERVSTIENNLSLNMNDSSNASSLTYNSQETPLSLLTQPRYQKDEKKKMQRNVRGSRYIGFVVVLFYFCWLPYVIVSLIGNMCKSCLEENLIPLVLYDVLLTLGFMNSALNPFLYPFHDKRFKEAFKDMWKRMRSKPFLKNVCTSG